MTNRDSPYFIGEASPTRAPFVTHVPATPSRFARTLREVIADDYMPEIEGLKRRLTVIETELPKLRFRAGPPTNPIPQMHPTTDEQANMVQYLSTDDDDRIADVMRHCNEQFYDVNSHLNEIDDALSDFVNSIGVCLLLTLSTYLHVLKTISHSTFSYHKSSHLSLWWNSMRSSQSHNTVLSTLLYFHNNPLDYLIHNNSVEIHLMMNI